MEFHCIHRREQPSLPAALDYLPFEIVADRSLPSTHLARHACGRRNRNADCSDDRQDDRRCATRYLFETAVTSCWKLTCGSRAMLTRNVSHRQSRLDFSFMLPRFVIVRSLSPEHRSFGRSPGRGAGHHPPSSIEITAVIELTIELPMLPTTLATTVATSVGVVPPATFSSSASESS